MKKKALRDNDADTTLGTRIYESIANEIIVGKLMPGHRLDEQSLATQFGVSRTPVREALRELGARRLIDLVPRRGGVVTQIGSEKLIDMLEAECEIEGLCARLAAHRMTAMEKGHLRELHEQAAGEEKSLTRYFEINKEFHDLICAGAHNSTLDGTARELRFRLSPFRRPEPSTDVVGVISRSTGEHSAIVAAILAGEAERAYEAMRVHNARVNLGAMKLLQSQPHPEESGPGNGRSRSQAS
ncbi:MAG: GntR family transcriptional regulator [Alphaproteobacteria bacterium]|nr:GntR family transcriptional regulator [Alphaproteobacteria bacterium]